MRRRAAAGILRAPMHSRWLRIFLLAFNAVWFGVVVPGHQRGCILVGRSADATSPTALKNVPSCHKPKEGSQSPGQKAPLKRSTCAICLFASTIEPPPAPDVIPRPACTSKLEQWRTPPPASVRFISWFDSRGPPPAC